MARPTHQTLQKMIDPDDWSWVKVKKWVPPETPCDCQLSRDLEKHHLKEVAFLRETITYLAGHLLNSKDYD